MREMQEIPHSMSFGRRIKFVLVSLGEMGIVVLGIIFALMIEDAAETYRYWDQDWVEFYPKDFQLFLVGGAIVTVFAFLWVRHKTRPWKRAYHLEGWVIRRAERQKNPKRWKRKRLAGRILIWVPIAIAAFVLFFYPAVSHVCFPRAGHLLDYRISLPWNWFVMPLEGPYENRSVEAWISPGWEYGFGLAPVWQPLPYPTGIASFESLRTEDIEDAYRRFDKMMNRESAHRELQVGDTKIMCWETLRDYDDGSPFAWSVVCHTPIEEQGRAFQARYLGSKKALPVFYDMLGGMKHMN